MKKKEIIILLSILFVSILIFAFYKMGYIRFYISKDSVYGQIKEISDDYILLESLNKSGGLSKGEDFYLEVPSKIEGLKIKDKIKFAPTKIEESNPPRVYADSIELIN